MNFANVSQNKNCKYQMGKFTHNIFKTFSIRKHDVSKHMKIS